MKKSYGKNIIKYESRCKLEASYILKHKATSIRSVFIAIFTAISQTSSISNQEKMFLLA